MVYMYNIFFGQSGAAIRGDIGEPLETNKQTNSLLYSQVLETGAQHTTQSHMGKTPGWSGGKRQGAEGGDLRPLLYRDWQSKARQVTASDWLVRIVLSGSKL